MNDLNTKRRSYWKHSMPCSINATTRRNGSGLPTTLNGAPISTCVLGYIQSDLSKSGSATKLRVPHGEFGRAEGRTADPSTTLRSGRDDNFVWER
jgi:hypothetical protein